MKKTTATKTEKLGVDLQKEFQPMISDWLKEEYRKEIRNMKWSFMDRTPRIGERCLIYQGLGKPVYFGYRSSQNWYNSGEWKIRVDTEGLNVVTIEEQ